MQHLLTIDVEASRRGLPRSDDSGDETLSAAMGAMLDLLAETGATATFFVLGQEAMQLKDVLRRCIRMGHEVGCHGLRHVRTETLGPDKFREDLTTALSLIQEAAQAPCRGYRAPFFSATPDMDWFFEILADAGMAYDASLRMPLNAIPHNGHKRGGVTEAPAPFLPIGPCRFGLLSGLVLRLLPNAGIRKLARHCERQGHPMCLYLHPYEWQDCHCRWFPLSMGIVRRKLLISRTLPKLKQLTQTLDLISIEKWLD